MKKFWGLCTEWGMDKEVLDLTSSIVREHLDDMDMVCHIRRPL